MQEKKENEERAGKQKAPAWVWFVLLHAALLVYSSSGIFSKKAARTAFMSKEFILFYAGMLFVLVIYAVLWQQVIKHLPVTTAFANKAVAVVWGIVLGRMFFQEQVTPRQIAAAAIIIAGAVLYVRSDAEVADDNR